MADTIGVRPTGDALGEASAEKIRKKNAENEERAKRMGYVPRQRRSIKVRLLRPDLKVPTGDGGLFPQGVFDVDPDDMYIGRRLMEGTLVQVVQETPEQQVPPPQQSQPDQSQPQTEPPPAEPAPAEEPA